MGKVNVYLPDDLEEAVRAAGLSISAICQLAVADLVATVQLLEGASAPSTIEALLASSTRITLRLRQMLQRLADETAGSVTTHDLFAAIVHHGENLGVALLAAAGVEPPKSGPISGGRLRQPARRRAGGGVGLLTDDAQRCLVDAVRVAVEMRHNYLGAEHLVIAMAMPGSPIEPVFAAAGVDAAALRRHAERLIANPWSARPGAAVAITTAHGAPAGTDRVGELERELTRLRADVDALAERVARNERKSASAR